MAGYIGSQPITTTEFDNRSWTGLSLTVLNYRYTPGFLQLFLNGVLLEDRGVDYTAVDGKTVVFQNAITPTDFVRVISNTATTHAKRNISQRTVFTALGGDTVFPLVETYTPGSAEVYLNGAKLVNDVDVDVSSGTQFVITSPLTADDIVEFIAWNTFSVADTYTKQEVDTRLKTNREVEYTTIVTQGQTTVAIQGVPATVGSLDVFINGVLQKFDDYTLISGGQVIEFAKPLNLNDEIIAVKLRAFDVANTYTKAEAVSKIDKEALAGSNVLTMDGNELTIHKGDGSVETAAVKAVRDISYISSAQHNNMLMVVGGKVYSACGFATVASNGGTGRGTTGTISLVGVHTGFSEIAFPGLPKTANLVKVGGNGAHINYAHFDNNYCYVWGNNFNGVLGLGHLVSVGVPTLMATDVVEVRDDNTWVNYSLLGAFLTKRTDGFIYASGVDGDGMLGLGTTELNRTTQVKLTWLGANPLYWSGSGAYGGSGLYQKADGTIWSSGAGEGGKLFDNSSSNTITPVEVTANVGGLSGGVVEFHHTSFRHYSTTTSGSASSILMRRKPDGTTSVYTVGYNAWGQLGNGTQTATATPFSVPGMSDIREIDVLGGNVSTVRVIKNNGDMYAWGHNAQGQAGLPVGNILSPTLVTTGCKKFLSKRMGAHIYEYYIQNWVAKEDGTTWVSGHGDNRALGNNSGTVYTLDEHQSFPASDPVKLLGSFDTTDNGRVGVAVTENNNVYAWGYNGQYGVHQYGTGVVNYPTSVILPSGGE